MAKAGKATDRKAKAERKVLGKKKRRHSKKGDRLGRDVAKVLSKWWTGGKDEGVFRYIKGYDVFRGRVRKDKGMRTEHYGDITATDERGKPFSDAVVVEIKKGYGPWSFLDILDKPQGGKQVFDHFWDQVTTDVANSGGIRYPVVIFQRDMRARCVAMQHKFFKILAPEAILRFETLYYTSKKDFIIVMRLEHFLNTVDPKVFSHDKVSTYSKLPKP